MSIRTKIQIEGIGDLLAAMETLKRSAKGRITRAAVNAGGRIIRKEAKANARAIKRTGQLAKLTDMKVKTYKGSGNTVAVIGPKKGGKIIHPVYGPVDPHKYANLVELGTERSSPKPFLRAALMTTKGQVASVMGNKARDQLAREVAKAAKKRGR